MKILVTGVKGQLGYDVCRVLTARGVPHRGIDIGELDLTDGQAVQAYLSEYCPDAVIHCAAYTAVDKAEDDAEHCYAVNTEGTAHLAKACATIDAKFLYISTDYVFSGKGTHFHTVDEPLGLWKEQVAWRRKRQKGVAQAFYRTYILAVRYQRW